MKENKKRQTNLYPSKKISTFQELNFLRRPITVLDTRFVGKPGVIKVTNGNKIWKISSDVTYGLGGPFDDAVFIALGKILSDKKKPLTNPVDIGTLRNVAKLLGYKNQGGSVISKIKTSIERLASLTIKTENTYFSKHLGRFLTGKVEGTFHLFDRVIFINEAYDNQVSEGNLIWINDVFLQNINKGYVCPLDLQFYFDLRNMASRAIFKVLIESFYASKNNNPICYRYSTICERITLKKMRYLSRAKQQLNPCHDELVSKGYLEKYTWSNIPNIRDDWYIYYLPGPLAVEKKLIVIPDIPDGDVFDRCECDTKTGDGEVVDTILVTFKDMFKKGYGKILYLRRQSNNYIGDREAISELLREGYSKSELIELYGLLLEVTPEENPYIFKSNRSIFILYQTINDLIVIRDKRNKEKDIMQDKAFKDLIQLIPEEHREKKTVITILSKYYQEKGYDCVKRNIQYTNKHNKQNEAYRPYLSKALKGDWGLCISEDKETKLKKRNEELKKQEEQLRLQKQGELKIKKEKEILYVIVKHIENLSLEEQQALRKEAASMLGPENQKKAEQRDLYAEVLIRFKMQEIIAERLNLKIDFDY